MSRTKLLALYSDRKQKFTTELSKVKKQINVISNARLATALILLTVIYFSFTVTSLLYAAVLLLVIFLVLVKKHARLFNEKTNLENLVRINHQEGEALNGNYSHFDQGKEFIDPHHPYSHDLDIFGEGSLFQYLNRCNTLSGKKKLAERLSSLDTLREISRQSIEEHQEATKELANKTDFRQHFQASGMQMGEQPDDYPQLLEWIQHPTILYHKKYFGLLLIILPGLTLASVIGAIIFSDLYLLAVLMVLIQWSVLGMYLKKINLFHDYISRKKNILERYAKLLHKLRNEEFNAKLLQRLNLRAEEADVKVHHLASLVNALDARLNFLMNIVVNGLLLYDLQCIYRLEKWKTENAEGLPVWIDAITEAEVLCSFGNFAFNNSSFQYAQIQNELSIQAHNLAHPLIDEHERISNDFTIGPNGRVLIITGANMAGKSTFLRTLGINLVLALNGAPVCASSFICPIIHLHTGMRTADSLKDHQSYFYAELDRLKTIMEELRSDKPLLILLDEILKGTNSTDKQAGSIALVKQLIPHPCLAVIATHDLALGSLEKEYPNQIRNFCFEANIQNDQLSFDYKLKPGLAQKMNATFLMKKMGIIPLSEPMP